MEISDALKHMRKVEETDKPKITEEAFVQRLLPLLLNQQEETDVDVTVWLEIAGNPHREIDVADRSGTVLFTVPPLVARTPTLAPTREGRGLNGIGEILATYSAKQASEHPVAAHVFLEHALRNEILTPDQQLLLECLRKWVFIYERYNLPTERILGPYTPKPAAAASAKVAPQDTIEDFDDF